MIDVNKMAAEIMALPIRKWIPRHFSTLGELLPESKDPDVVFKNNWLAKGQAFAIVAGSGIGKSSLSVQVALHWAVGMPMLAEPLRPLKIAIIQAEDSDRDLKEQRNGMIRGLTEFEGWTHELIDAADANIILPTEFIGRGGSDFINLLRDFQGDTHQDLIIINPLQSFFAGDVSSQEDTYVFANGIDSIIKNEDMKCVAGIVMHTAKWKSGDKEKRQDVSDFGEYIMAGSHGWTDWLRAILAFQKHGSSEDYFDLRAPKRGKRLGWTDADGNPTTTKIMKHSDGFIYWQEVTDPDEIAAIPEPPKKQAGNPGKEKLDILKAAVNCATKYTEDCRGKMRDAFIENFWKIDRREHSKSDWGEVFDELVDNCQKYGFKVMKITSGNGRKSSILG